MPIEIQTALISGVFLLAGVLLGWVVSHFTARNQHKMDMSKFYREKEWEHKRDIYSKTLTRLSELEYYFRELKTHADMDWESPERRNRSPREQPADLDNIFDEAFSDLEKITAGGFMLSPQVIAAVNELMSHVSYKIEATDEMTQSVTWWNYVEAQYAVMADGIEKIRELAEADLCTPPIARYNHGSHTDRTKEDSACPAAPWS